MQRREGHQHSPLVPSEAQNSNRLSCLLASETADRYGAHSQGTVLCTAAKGTTRTAACRPNLTVPTRLFQTGLRKLAGGC